MLLAVLGHVDADHRGIVVEEELSQRLRQLGLAHAGGAEEEEGTDRAVRVSHARARAAHRVGHRVDRVLLADHAPGQQLLHVQKLLGLALHHLARRDAGPGGHDLRDHVRGDLLGEHRLLGLAGARLRVRELLLQLGDAAVA